MTPFAIALVLLSALLHALWNFAAKRARGGPAFVWLFGVFEVCLYLPFVIYLILAEAPGLNLIDLLFIMGSASLHLGYFLLLSRGYQLGDLSLVYPLARAIGPLIATIAAIALFAERPTLLAFLGGLLICGGVFWLTGDLRKLRQSDSLPGVLYAGLTGLSIAAYTLWDSYAVSRLLIAPLIYQWGIDACRLLLLTPYNLRHWQAVRDSWREDRWKALVVGVLSSLSYLLMLAALAFSPVSYVAPLRVISTLIGVMLGTRFLGEGDVLRRLSAAGAMMLGVFALSLG
jgi:drug/metabolite transporter (DMT)-like permease